MIANYVAQGAEVYCIHVPADDFGYVVSQAQRGVLTPFQPTLLNVPCMPWEHSHLGVMARKREEKQPLLVDNRGRALDVTQGGD
jgi:hypothetical protein